ncbi:UvrD-helicase domain-containing protein [Clostridium vitabionis]|uniref:UvrD-helicase domain-containing protein n=1 Tax=Clostridium vitabionis TaxID=2784388 RepID=UPI00188D1481|nr:UvrD-helicase domain-containing protein [Clostridium vitabionis]
MRGKWPMGGPDSRNGAPENRMRGKRGEIMAITFTPKQTKVLNARNHNILVSAAAGSGKTAVLVERIVRMISDPEKPLDIDRLLVVTFTRAAAAQMRERIGKAISKKLMDDPGNRHLQKQEILLHHAQITTIDSFCSTLLRNNFSEIGLDPAFRVMDENEAELLEKDVMEAFLEKAYDRHMGDGGETPEGFDDGLTDDEFREMTDYFCDQIDDDRLSGLMFTLYRAAASHPGMERWLRDREKDYACGSEEEMFSSAWIRELLEPGLLALRSVYAAYLRMEEICLSPLGPGKYYAPEDPGKKPSGLLIRGEKEYLERLFGGADVPAKIDEMLRELRDPAADWRKIRAMAEVLSEAAELPFESLPRMVYKKKEKEAADFAERQRLQNQVKELRDQAKKTCADFVRYTALAEEIPPAGGSGGSGSGNLENPSRQASAELHRMRRAAGPASSLAKITLAYLRELDQAKKDRNVIDFADMERYALRVLIREEDGVLRPTPAALACRRYYEEVLIDEYQDSNEVQELLLGVIGGDLDMCRGTGKEDQRRYARFMVGDVKQSIYRFRGACPELFIEKFSSYRENDPVTERIDLDQNFRSRPEVLDAANAVFRHIMRREIGGVDYDGAASLKAGASYPPGEVPGAYTAELIAVETEEDGTGADSAESDSAGAEAGGKRAEAAGAAENGADAAENGAGAEADNAESISSKEKEILAITRRIRQLTGADPGEDGRSARPLMVTDEETGELRPVRYSDIVILLRSQVTWNDEYRKIFEQEGIPILIENQAGYFETAEIREILCLLETLDNPRQDIPLYGVMRGYFGGFTEDEIGQVRAAAPRGMLLCGCLESAAGRSAAEESSDGEGESAAEEPSGGEGRSTAEESEKAAGSGISPELREKCARLLDRIDALRKEAEAVSIHELLGHILYDSGFAAFAAALPSGNQRSANLRFLVEKAQDFEKTSYTGLFQFLRYIDQIRKYSVDYGEVSVRDEKAEGVRVMTIHKSKGLEFPVCFVAGLASRFSAKDTGGPLLLDGELGMGIDYFEEETRSICPTLRKEAIAQKIRRDSLGEELRVLYVAMTRAKEKLILVGNVKSLGKRLGELTSGGLRMNAGGKLPAEMIAGSGSFPAPRSYFDLLLIALSAELLAAGGVDLLPGTEGEAAPEDLISGMREGTGGLPVRLSVVSVKNLASSREEGQRSISDRISLLMELENATADALPDPALAKRLRRRFSRQYSHQNLDGLCLVTTVSEIKQAAMAGSEEEGGETARDFYRKHKPEEYIPRFAREAETAGCGDDIFPDAVRAAEGSPLPGGAGQQNPATDAGRETSPGGAGRQNPAADAGQETSPGGAERGTAVHRVCELMDYRRFPEPAAVTEREYEDWKRELVRKGKLTGRQAKLVPFAAMRRFLASGIAARMAAADRAGLLRREQVFVHGINADRLYPHFPREETILVQGIIDAFFIEAVEKGSRRLVLIDYKTDRVNSGEELLDRYRIQLELYSDALADMFHLPVSAEIFSFALGREVPVPAEGKRLEELT